MRSDALNRHQNVHRPHVPLQRFRACTQCAASRVKCSGTLPCVRCEKKSLACAFPKGSEHADPASVGADERGGQDARDTSPRSNERQSMMIAAHQHQHEYQHPAAVVPTQEPRTEEAYGFMQQQTQAVDLMSQEMDTHMISALNWISPTMDFELAAGFDYNPLASGEQYWNSPTAIENMPSQSSPAEQTLSSMEDTPHSNPASFKDSSDVQRPGTAYVDSKGFRQPRAGRYASRIFAEESSRKSTHRYPELQRMTPELDAFDFALPPVPDLPSQETDAIHDQQFTLEQYRTMCQAFEDFCVTASGVFHDVPFLLPAELPSISVFTTLIALYRRHFDSKVLPIIHTRLHRKNTSSWIVKLALSAIGSQYAGTLYTELAVVLHEFLRRVLRPCGAVFSTSTLTVESLGVVQAKLLNYIGLSYCGSGRLHKYRISTLQDLVGEYMSLHRTQSVILRGEVAFQNPQDWVLSESVRRVCHAIWLIESMSQCHFDTQSTLLLDSVEVALPCKEDIWQADTDQIQTPVCQPTLGKGLRVLYVEKRLLDSVGDFGQVLIIHGLFCQTWDIAKSLSKPLLRWTPSAQKGDAESHELTSMSWLPQVPLYNSWRNAACDCLDVLHWIANSNVAKTGTEHATVLHLHFARLVLLAPYQTIREMAELLVVEASTHDDSAENLQHHCQAIQRWIADDQFKARLALVHCGILFWHVRRYSKDAFYEPATIFLATLVVWAYGSLCAPQQLPVRIPSQASNHSRPPDDADCSSDSDDMPSSVRLDRPVDDELVQIFIKRGRCMSATITGVGNITATKGPSRMLREGCKLLNTLDEWPIRRKYLHILTRLAAVCGQDKQWLQARVGTSTPAAV